MAPPTPLECSVTECPFTTPAGCPTWDIMANLLQQHTQAVHSVGVQQGSSSSSKLEKLPRPTFTLNMNEAQWSFKKMQWDNYIKQGQSVSEEVKLLQLQAACDDSLRQRVFDTGTYSTLTTEDLFLTKMKELAVIIVHKSIHLRNLWKTVQQSDEQVRAFVARATATADMCNMEVPCPNTACQRNVSYRDHVVMQVIIHGLRDNDIRVRVLSRNTSGELTTLPKLIDYIAAEEAGTAEASDLVSDANLVGGIKRSTYSQQRNGSQRQKCGACGEARHEDRKRQCKAWGKICDKCKKPNHLAKVCNSARTSSIEAGPSSSTETTTSANTVNASLDCIKTAKPVTSFFSLEAGASLPTCPADVHPVIAAMHTSQGPITTLPLPHHVHSIVHGWLQSKPKQSPSITAQFSLDRRGYAELGLNLPRFRQAAHNPGRSTEKPSICDTGAQLTVVPYSLVENMKIRHETMFPVETTINGASNVPIMVEGGVLMRVTAYNSQTGEARHSRQLVYENFHQQVRQCSHVLQLRKICPF